MLTAVFDCREVGMDFAGDTRGSGGRAESGGCGDLGSRFHSLHSPSGRWRFKTRSKCGQPRLSLGGCLPIASLEMQGLHR